MAKKTIQFERLQLTEEKLIDKFNLEKDGFLRGDYSERLLEGLTRFTDIWRDNHKTLVAHPAVLKAFHEAVTALADAYLKGGHLQEIDDIDARDRTRLRILEFRDNVRNQYDKATSVEQGRAEGFTAGLKAGETREIAKASGFLAGLKAAEAKKVATANAQGDASGTAPQGQQEVLPAERDGSNVVTINFHISGSNVFINADPQSWAAASGQTQTAADIAQEGPKRRGRKPGK